MMSDDDDDDGDGDYFICTQRPQWFIPLLSRFDNPPSSFALGDVG
jgi:hypothetical protein